MKKLLTVIASCIITAGFLVGCGDGVDENKSVDQIKAEAAKLDKAQIEAKINACKKAVEDKAKLMEKKVKELAEKIKENPLDLNNPDRKKLDEEIKALKASAEKINEQIKAYMDAMTSAK